jgi:RNA polymerase sigma-70 factor, ECF subfamily
MDETQGREDRRLSERIAAGDAGALEEVYDAYSGAVYRQALAILGSAADAEDVLQDVFLQLVRRPGTRAADVPIRDLKAYLLTAARHHACSALRRRRRCAPADDAEAVLSHPAAPSDGSSDRVAVREALQSLPVAQRQVVILKVYEELTFEEIGRRVQASVNTVASRYRYALQKLRKVLGDVTDAP